MLGKTNITAIESGTIISDIEDYRWDRVRVEGVTGSFIQSIYENDTLVAITKDGIIVYTMDGENWSKVRLDIEGTYELADVIWDGRRYVMVGSREEIVEQEYIYHGFIVVTEDLINFNIIHAEDEYSRYYAVVEKEGKYIVISKEKAVDRNCGAINVNIGRIENWDSRLKEQIMNFEYTTYINATTNGSDYAKVTCDCQIIVAKNTQGGILYVKFFHAGRYSPTDRTYWTQDWHIFKSLGLESLMSGFEFKGKIYVYNNNNLLFKVNTNTGEKYNAGGGVFYEDAVSYDKSEIFLNEYGIVIVRNGESISEKTEDDLIEITYDFSMELIVKAFTKLYICGTGGNILKSNNEVNNEEALAVNTMSASKALHAAKLYTDKKYNALEARIKELEKAK